MARRREMMRSKHADEARRDLLARDRTRPLGEGEIEAELNRLKVLNQINRSGIFENFIFCFLPSLLRQWSKSSQ